MDFEFERIADGQKPASRVSVTFQINGHPVTAATPEGMILLMLLQEIRELRKELRGAVPTPGSTDG